MAFIYMIQNQKTTEIFFKKSIRKNPTGFLKHKLHMYKFQLIVPYKNYVLGST